MVWGRSMICPPGTWCAQPVCAGLTHRVPDAFVPFRCCGHGGAPVPVAAMADPDASQDMAHWQCEPEIHPWIIGLRHEIARSPQRDVLRFVIRSCHFDAGLHEVSAPDATAQARIFPSAHSGRRFHSEIAMVLSPVADAGT